MRKVDAETLYCFDAREGRAPEWRAVVVFEFEAADREDARATVDDILDGGIGVTTALFTITSIKRARHRAGHTLQLALARSTKSRRDGQEETR